MAEYIDIKGLKYDPEIGVFGMNFNILLEKPGYAIKRRKRLQQSIHKKRIVSSDEAINFMKENFGVEIEEE